MFFDRKAIVFVALIFAIGWIPLIAAWFSGRNQIANVGIAGLIYFLSPAIAATVCGLAFEKGQRLKALGLWFRPNWWWAWAFLIAIALVAVNVVVTATLSSNELSDIEGIAHQLASTRNQEQYSDPASCLVKMTGLITLSAVQGWIINTVTEELGWRGYLYHLWRPFGFWRASLVIGFGQGVWHWPMIYFYGLNYPGHTVFGLALFPVITTLMGPVMTLLRDRGCSVWASGICHGTFNAVSVLPAAMLNQP